MIFYGPPTHAAFYPEFADMVHEDVPAGGPFGGCGSAVLVGKEDGLPLERIIGTANAKMMLKSIPVRAPRHMPQEKKYFRLAFKD